MLIQTNINHNVLVDAAIAASKLLKRYGQSVYSSVYSQAIQEASPETAAIIIAAKTTGKDTAEKLRHIVKILKNTAEQYQPHFVVHGREEVLTEIDAFVHKQEKDAHIDKHITQDDEVSVSGE